MALQLTPEQAELLEDAEDRLKNAQGALSAFISALRETKGQYHVLSDDLFYLLLPIHSNALAAMNDLDVLQGR